MEFQRLSSYEKLRERRSNVVKLVITPSPGLSFRPPSTPFTPGPYSNRRPCHMILRIFPMLLQTRVGPESFSTLARNLRSISNPRGGIKSGPRLGLGRVPHKRGRLPAVAWCPDRVGVGRRLGEMLAQAQRVWKRDAALGAFCRKTSGAAWDGIPSVSVRPSTLKLRGGASSVGAGRLGIAIYPERHSLCLLTAVLEVWMIKSWFAC